MKFAQEFDRELVPEWRAKYLNYKTGKSHVKALTRAVSRKNNSASFKKDLAESREKDKDSFPPSDKDSIPKTNLASEGDIPRQSRVMFQLPEPAIVSTPIKLPKWDIQEDGRPLLKPLIIPEATSVVKPKDPSVNTMPSVVETPTPSRLRWKLPVGLARVQTEKLASIIDPQNIVRLRQVEFFRFLDSELDKVDTFYLEKETATGKRLAVLREQLHIMRDYRAKEIVQFEKRRGGGQIAHIGQSFDSVLTKKRPNFRTTSKLFKSGQTSEPQRQNLPFTPISPNHDQNQNRDYTRRVSQSEAISYSTARSKLKLALQEFYRGLELLKSYALLNRTAFRKINKKYDKALNPNAKPKYKYMNDKVNKSIFVTSNLLDDYTNAVEDLYTRYFEGGNHKLAVGKLRKLTRPREDRSESAFLNGALLGVGFTFGVEGVVYGIRLLNDADPVKKEQTSLLLQIYAGYALMLYMFSLFCLNCRIWTSYKISYTFIFEFDTKHDLDWRELSEFPSFFLMLLGGFVWLNFSGLGNPEMFIYYPVILIFITICLIILPLPVLRYQSRKWFANSHYRLLFAGLFPVEFRDLSFGDMYCSLTYAMANCALFFCLYAKRWDNTPQCGSRQSRILGFLVALPPIWRSFQCIRRYVDTRNAFPHLANLVKYLIAVFAAMSLSLYRIHPSQFTFSLFVGLSSVSSILNSVWDITLDFSLLQSGARVTGLRDTMAFSQSWIYYGIMIIDPILRFGWVPLAIFTHNIQHSSVASFIVAFAEVTRRGLWLLIRVENEHCSNIGQAKASRDIPLPYKVDQDTDVRTSTEILRDEMFGAIEMERIDGEEHPQQGYSTSTPLMESGQGHLKQRMNGACLSLGRTNTVKEFSKMLARAHTEDFQKRKGTGKMGGNGETRREKGISKALQSDEELDDEVNRDLGSVRREN